jgi:phosphoglycerate dehydrogenase-like enzyme
MGYMEEINVLITLPFPEPLLARLQAISPKLQFHVHPARTPDELPEELLPTTEVLYTIDTLPPRESVPNLAWIQCHYAGVEHISDNPLLRSKVQVTTMSGAAAPQMAEYALMSILALARRLPRMVIDKAEKHWDDDRFTRFRPHDLRGSTVGIVGYGSVGREVARLCNAFGARILATKRDLKNLEDVGYIPDGLGDRNADLVTRLYPPEALKTMAKECDFLVVTAPLTPNTRGLVGEKVIAALKPTAFLIDISRGGVVDQGALVTALNDNRLAGAALDVYPLEPLPEKSPLWEFPNVIVSPHIAGASSKYFEQAADLFQINLQRYLDGKPLLNLYESKLGY